VTTPPASPDPEEGPTAAIDPSENQPEKPRKSRRRRIIFWTSISLVSVLVIGAAGLVGDAWWLNHRIKVVPITLPPHTTVPAKAQDALKAQNFVLIGSDSRAGASGKGTGASDVQGARSDTTIILHIAANNGGATLISIPRDSYVSIPSCVQNKDGQTSAPETSKFNAAFSLGGEYNAKYGPSCTIHTIETLTGIHIDHYAVVDFAGFKSMVSALGGVKMCVATPLVDPIVGNHYSGFHGSGLDLPEGKSVEIDGQQALDLMRARYALDGGGDLPRIKRQQLFIGAMIRKATSGSLLENPAKLQRFLVAATGSLTTDGFGIGTMKKLAGALHKEGAGKVRILTVPTIEGAPGVPLADVEWDPTKAPALWNAIIHDKPIPGTKKKPTPTASPTPTPPALSVSPSGVSIALVNGTTQPNLGATVESLLQEQGFNVVTVTNAKTTTHTRTVVKYGPEKVQSSQTVSESIPGSVRKADPNGGSTITVVLGSNYASVIPVTLGTVTPTPTPTISSISANSKDCLS
jgi:LCP family protein required for cell wall assembly